MKDIVCGDCKDVLAIIPDESVDLIVTDPPYGISFMGKDWDRAVPPVDIWRECLRVLKPGAFAFVMSIPRMDCLSEMGKRLAEAGFETGFTPIFWAYASGYGQPEVETVSPSPSHLNQHSNVKFFAFNLSDVPVVTNVLMNA